MAVARWFLSELLQAPTFSVTNSDVKRCLEHIPNVLSDSQIDRLARLADLTVSEWKSYRPPFLTRLDFEMFDRVLFAHWNLRHDQITDELSVVPVEVLANKLATLCSSAPTELAVKELRLLYIYRAATYRPTYPLSVNALVQESDDYLDAGTGLTIKEPHAKDYPNRNEEYRIVALDDTYAQTMFGILVTYKRSMLLRKRYQEVRRVNLWFDLVTHDAIESPSTHYNETYKVCGDSSDAVDEFCTMLASPASLSQTFSSMLGRTGIQLPGGNDRFIKETMAQLILPLQRQMQAATATKTS